MAKTLQVKADIIADTASYVAGVKRATAATDKFGRAAKKTRGKDPLGFGAVAKSAVAATAGVVSLYGAYSEGKKAIDATTKLAKGTLQLQRVTNMSARDASRFAAVLQERGIEANKASVSFTALSKQIVAAQSGTKKAADAFKQLGVSQELIKKGDTQKVLLAAADGLSKMGAGADRTALAAQIFGKGYKDLLPLLLLGSKGIKKQTDLAGRLGAEFSGKGLKSAKEFIKGQREMSSTLTGVQVALGTALMPALTKGMKAVTKFVLQFRDGKGAGGEFKKKLIEIKDTLIPVAEFIRNHAKLVFGMITAWYAFKKAALAINVFSTILRGFGSVASWTTAGRERGVGFGSGLKGGVGKFGKIGTAGLIVGGMLAVKEYGPAIDKWQQGLAAKIKAKFPAFRLLGGDLIDALGTVTQGAGLGSVGAAIKGARATAKASKGGFVSDGKAILNSLGLGGKQSASKLSDATRAAISAAAAAAKRGARGFPAIGRNISSGLAAGISQGIQSVVNAAVKIVNDARDAAKRASKQNSPSLVFAEIGAGLVEGMALGMSRTTPLVKAAAKMVKAAYPKVDKGALNRSIQIGKAGAAGAPFGVGGAAADQTELLLAQYAATHVKKLTGAKTKKGREAQAKANAAAQTRADNALAAIEAKQAAKAARAAAGETLKGFVQGILDTIKSTELDRIMKPVNEARAARAASESSVARGGLEAGISRAQAEAADPRVQARYQRDAARLDARMAQARKQGNLEALDALQSEKNALDARYGPKYLAELQDQLAQLNENEIEASSEAAAIKFANTFSTGMQGALGAFMKGGTVTDFFAKLTAAMAGSGVTPGGLPASVTAGVGEAAAVVGGTTSVGAVKSAKVATLAEWVVAWLGQHPNITSKKPVNESVVGKAFGVGRGAVWKAGGSFGGRVANKASGGYLTPGAFTMVGETGPELVVGGKVSSATRTSRMGSGGMNITINAVGAAANDPVALARELGWQLATR